MICVKGDFALRIGGEHHLQNFFAHIGDCEHLESRNPRIQVPIMQLTDIQKYGFLKNRVTYELFDSNSTD